MQPLQLLSSMATRELLADLAGQYTRRTTQTVAAQAAGGVNVAKRVQEGEAIDVVVLASDAIDTLIAAGKVLPGRADVVRSGIAIAVKAGAAALAVGDEQGVKTAVLAAKTLSYSTGPSGVYLEALFAKWGIIEQIRARIVVPPPGVPVGSLVADGSVELGFQQLSELISLAGVTVLGPLPDAIQSITIFSAGVAAASSSPQASRELMTFLTSPELAQTKRRYGMQPA